MGKLKKYYPQRIECDEIWKCALNALDYGVWEWNVDNGEMFISEKIKDIVENDLFNIKTMYEFIDNIAYNIDKALAIKELYECINGNRYIYQSTFRLKNKNSTWVLIKGKISKSAEHCRLFSGIMSEISENKLNKNRNEITKIPNKLFFLKRIDYFLDIAKLHNNKVAIIYINIRNFKGLNMIFDYNIGDIILMLFSQSITKIVHKYGELGKIGEDEFAILVYKFNTIEDIKKMCNEIYEYFREPLKIMDHIVYIEVNIGISIFPEHGSNSCELLKHGCFAMNNSKEKGKKTYAFFDRSIFDIYCRRVLIENELTNSIFNNELEVYYQPQVDILNNKIVGVEALLRWKNKKLGLVSPEEFIPIIENNGYIIEIGNWVLDKVIYTMHKWKERGTQVDSVAINISPVQLKRSDFKNKLLGLCTKYDIAPSLLELEITEGTLLEICDDNIKVFNQLVESHINIALDDFGTRYSSLSYLASLPVSTLKIDKLFVDGIQHKKNKILIKSIVDLSKSLNCKLIIEGVETEKQVHILNSLGCNIMQGYYFSKPLSKEELENLLANIKFCRNKL
ncbi:putative bifunctional diguanylate cyclase/phosphodiesterase [Clostridium sp.]|jgi:diguanylate cyclase (GGDEF)-like protein|uniref:putative bifunctional diguanylate cyclase/phosphodiesterase n=1 Tax=Clostridium sp. TaxID=1506 RepID=UPI002FDD02A9